MDKGCADHLKEKGIVPYGYDVINEPIADGRTRSEALMPERSVVAIPMMMETELTTVHLWSRQPTV